MSFFGTGLFRVILERALFFKGFQNDHFAFRWYICRTGCGHLVQKFIRGYSGLFWFEPYFIRNWETAIFFFWFFSVRRYSSLFLIKPYFVRTCLLTVLYFSWPVITRYFRFFVTGDCRLFLFEPYFSTFLVGGFGFFFISFLFFLTPAKVFGALNTLKRFDPEFISKILDSVL